MPRVVKTNLKYVLFVYFSQESKLQEEGLQLMSRAIKQSQTERLLRLVQARPDWLSHVLLETEYDDTALCLATREGLVQVVRTLVEAGALVNQANKSGVTPLLLRATLKLCNIWCERDALL